MFGCCIHNICKTKKLLLKTASLSYQRYYAYKPIKRVTFNESIQKPYVAQKISKMSLAKVLRTKIEATGPITIAEYMREVLTNPNSGYYMSRDVFGQQGDFITSPEIGQIFGELISVWCLTEWQKIGSPTPLQIIELGPGRGTLIQDIIRVFTHFKLEKQITLHLVEISPYLSRLQAQKLCFQSAEIDNPERMEYPHYREGETLSGAKIYWYKRVEDIPDGFSCLLAHEFFDALPLNKFQKDGDMWKEIQIDADKEQENKFRYVISRSETPTSKLFNMKYRATDEKRDHVEYSFETERIVEHIAAKFVEHGGFGLIMDYGHFGDKTDTFRAFKDHKLHDALLNPGSADLTADVDFKHLKASFQKDNKLIAFGPIEQRQFLTSMGSDLRLAALLQNSNEKDKEQLQSGYDMLTNPEKMGSRFKFLSIFPSVLKTHLETHPVSGFDG